MNDESCMIVGVYVDDVRRVRIKCGCQRQANAIEAILVCLQPFAEGTQDCSDALGRARESLDPLCANPEFDEQLGNHWEYLRKLLALILPDTHPLFNSRAIYAIHAKKARMDLCIRLHSELFLEARIQHVMTSALQKSGRGNLDARCTREVLQNPHVR